MNIVPPNEKKHLKVEPFLQSDIDLEHPEAGLGLDLLENEQNDFYSSADDLSIHMDNFDYAAYHKIQPTSTTSLVTDSGMLILLPY